MKNKFLNYLRAAILLAMLGGLSMAWGQALPMTLKKKQIQELDELVERQVEGLAPGLSVGILQNGELLYEKYAGYANLEHKVLIGPNTSFNIASNAKQFTAVAILTLAEGGKLDLEDDIRKHLPELYKDNQEKITIKHLLNHSSGIRDVYALWSIQGIVWWEQVGLSNGDAIELLTQQRDLNFKPGTQYDYSNSNYILLAEIVKRVSGEEFNDYVVSMVKKLQMVETGFAIFYMQVIPNKARPYGNWGQWTEYPTVTELQGDGGLFTSLKDLLIWERMIQMDRQGMNNNPVLGLSQQPIPGAKFEKYGYGLEFGTYKGLDITFHDGSTGAYNSTFFRFPKENLSIVVMSNSGNVSPHYLVEQCTEIVFGKDQLEEPVYSEMPVRTHEDLNPERLLGDYERTDGVGLRVILVGDTLTWDIYNRNPLPLVKEAKNQYALAVDPMVKMIFEEGQQGELLFTVYYPGEDPAIHRRLPDYTPGANYFQDMEGSYSNDEVGVVIDLKYLGDQKFRATSENWEDWEPTVEYRTRDFFRLDQYKLRVDRGNGGEVKALLVSDSRLKNVVFKRQEN